VVRCWGKCTRDKTLARPLIRSSRRFWLSGLAKPEPLCQIIHGVCLAVFRGGQAR